MKLEIRSDGLHISGYVNVTEKMSRPVITGKGQKVIEVIEPRAFEKALERAQNVTMTKDHYPDPILAETRTESLTLYEDAIGLHAETLITDADTIEEARAGKIKGWSFGMTNVEDWIEERADALPIRHVIGLDLDHITLVVKKNPFYAATSVEVRADDSIETMEYRGFTEYHVSKVEDFVARNNDDGTVDTERVLIETTTQRRHDNSEYQNRINAIKQP